MSANASVQLQRVNEKGWRRGLGNLLQGEYSAWFRSSRWWKQLTMWIVIINGMMGMMIYATFDAARSGQEGPPILFMYSLFGGMFAGYGTTRLRVNLNFTNDRNGNSVPDDQEIGFDTNIMGECTPVWPYNNSCDGNMTGISSRRVYSVDKQTAECTYLSDVDGGFTGLSAAAHLAKAGTSVS